MSSLTIANQPGIDVWFNPETATAKEVRVAAKTENYFTTAVGEPTAKGGNALFGTRVREAIDTIKHW